MAYHGQDGCWYSYTEQSQSSFCAHGKRCACLFPGLCIPSRDQSQLHEWYCVCYLNVGRSRNSLASHLGRLNAWNVYIPCDVSVSRIYSITQHEVTALFWESFYYLIVKISTIKASQYGLLTAGSQNINSYSNSKTWKMSHPSIISFNMQTCQHTADSR